MTIQPRTRIDCRHFDAPKIHGLPCSLHPEDKGWPSNPKRCAECFRIARRHRYADQGETANSRYATARASAERRGLEFSLTLEEFGRILALPCVYQYGAPAPTGIDRIDSSKGYTPRNCQ